MAAEERVVELIIDASGVEAGMRRAETAYDHMSDRAEAATAKAQAAFDRQIQVYTGRLPKSIDGVGDAYDRLQARMDPVFHAQLRAEREMTQSLAVINRAVLLGVTTEEQATRDIIRLKQQQVEAIKRVRDAQMTPVHPPAGSNDNNVGYRRQNLGYQGFDIGQGLASGMPVGLIAAQQLPQVAQLYAGSGGVKTFLSDAGALAAGVVSSFGAMPIAIAAAGAAGLYYASSTSSEVKKLDDVFEEHTKTIGRLEKVYGTVITRARDYAGDSTRLLSTLGRTNLAALDTSRRQENSDLSSVFGVQFARTGGASDIETRFQPFAEAIRKLRSEFKAGKPDFDSFWNSVNATAAISADPKIRKLGDELIVTSQKAAEANSKFQEQERILKSLYDTIGSNGRLLSQGALSRDDAGNLAVFEARQAVEASRRQNALDAQLSSLNARSPQEKAGAARQSAGAQYNNDETAAMRRMRIEQAGTLALAQAQKSLTEATEARARNLGKMVADQQLEILLLGKTAGETAALRREYELVNQLKEESRQNGGIVEEGEVARIQKTAAEVGKLTDQIARMRLQQDAAFEAEQLFRSEREANIAAQLKAANLPVDLSGADAANLRSLEILKENKQAWEDIRDVGRDAIDELSSGALNGFQDIETIFKGIANDILGEFNKLAVANPLKNALYGDTLPTLSSVGGAGGILGTLFGGKNPAVDAAKQAVASMSVTAASVVVNGGGAAGAISSLLPANDNKPVGAVTRSALAPVGSGAALGYIGNYKSGVDPRLTDILNTAAKQFPGYKVDAMSGFRPGDPRFHGKGLATDVQLTDLVSGRKLGNYQDAASFGSYEKFAQTARQVQMAKYPELSDDFRWGGYFSGGKGKYGAADTMHFDLGGKRVGMGGGSWEGGLNSAQRSLWPEAQSKGLESAAQAIDKITVSSKTAATGLGSLGSGLNTFGDALSQFPAAPQSGGGGGFGSWLSGLFRGAFVPNGGQATLAANGGLGLYANGGISNRPAIFGEAGPEAAVPLPDGRRIPVEMRMPRIAANNGGVRPVVNRSIHFHGAPSGYTAEIEEEEDDQGNEKVNVIFSKIAATEAKRPGSPLNKALKTMGAREQRVRR